MSKISVVIPVYNVEKYINRCIDSVLEQSFNLFDLILVDDGSADRSGAICDEYEKKDNRIYVIHKKNGGLSDARNAGIEWALKNSDSEWITFIDSDDWVHPNYLDYLYRAVQDNGVALSAVRFKRVDTYQAPCEEEYNCSIAETQDLFFHERTNLVVACCKLFKKQDFQSVRFPVGRIHEDEFTTYKVLFNHEKIAYIDAALYYYYYNSQSIMNKDWKLSRLDAIEAHRGQVAYFKKHKIKKAYDVSAKVLLCRCAESVQNLREYYPDKIGLRVKYFALYYFCVIKRYRRYLTKKQKKAVGAQVHPKSSQFIKWLNKRMRNFWVVVRMKNK